MKSKELIAISDLHEMAVLDYARVVAERTQHMERRYIGFYLKAKADPVLAKYRAGKLTVIARSFVESIRTTKDRVFDAERTEKLRQVTLIKNS